MSPSDRSASRTAAAASPSASRTAAAASRTAAPSFGSQKPFKDVKKLMSAIQLNAIDGCNLKTLLTDIAYKPSVSASRSVMLVGKLRQKPHTEVILKVSPATDERAIDNSMFVETEIYARVINPLYAGRITPHVTPCLGTLQCTDFVRSLGNYSPAKARWNKITDFLDASGSAANMVVLQMNAGSTMSKFLDTLDPCANPGDHAKFVSVLFQVIYTLHCFAKVGLRHNDLHLNNILVETNSPVQELSYFIDERTVYTVPTHGLIAKIYDFDRASVVGMTRNRMLDREYCAKYGTCNGENPVFDIYTLIHQVYFTHLAAYACNTELKQDLREIIRKDSATLQLYYDEHNYFHSSHLMCKPKDDVSRGCAGEYEWAGKDFPTPEVFLRTLRAFQTFRVPPSSVKPALSATFFADEALRARFNVTFKRAPTRPVINRRYIMNCIKCNQWSGVIKQHTPTSPDLNTRMLIILFGWLAQVVFILMGKMKGTEARRVFNMFDAIIEYVQKHVVARSKMQLIGILFLQKMYGFHMDDLLYYTDNAFNVNDADAARPAVAEFEPACHSTLEYLFYCYHPRIRYSDRRALKRRYPDVLALLAKMYSNREWLLINPEDRALWIKEKIIDGTGSDAAINAIFDEDVPTIGAYTELLAKIAESSPKHAA